MAFKRFIGKGFIAIALIVFSASAVVSCAGRNTEDTTEPVVSDEASIPVRVSEPETQEEFDPDLIKKPADKATEVIEVPGLKDELAVAEDTPSKPNKIPARNISGSIDDSWFLVAEVSGNKIYEVYVDTGSIENAADGVESWCKLVFDSTQRDDDGLSYDEVHIESSIDCEGKTYAYNTSKFYNKIGQLVYQEDIEYNRTEITPDTLSAYVAGFVCGYDFETN